MVTVFTDVLDKKFLFISNIFLRPYLGSFNVTSANETSGNVANRVSHLLALCRRAER